jgi:glycosyltransferase involved in cell wall biosynthesis
MVPRISICIIAKNEEKYIENCLKSVLPIAYEIIVLDTGSTDRTKEICLGFNSPPGPIFTLNRSDKTTNRLREMEESGFRGELKLFETTWKDDFSKARNECISYATGDWILSIDADEVLTEETQKTLLPFLEKQQNTDRAVVYYFKIEVILSIFNSLSQASFFRQALFKANKGLKFFRPVHEEIYNDENDFLIFKCPFLTIYHTKSILSKTENFKKTKKYISILRKAIENNPDQNDNYFYYHNLGNAYQSINEHNKALENYYLALDIYKRADFSEKNSFYGNMLVMFIRELLYQKKITEAKEFTGQLENLFQDFPDTFFYKGYIEQCTGNFNNAIASFQQLIQQFTGNLQLNSYSLISYEDNLIPQALLGIGRCFMILGNQAQGLKYLEKAYGDSPYNSSVLLHLIKYHLLAGNLKKFSFYYFKYNPHFPLAQREKIESIANLTTKDDPEYLELIKSFLSEILEKDWLTEELVLINTTLNDLEKKLLLTKENLLKEIEPLKEKIKISVCIISRNDEPYIENCLKSVLPIAYEIIVLDIGSTDSTKEICLAFNSPPGPLSPGLGASKEGEEESGFRGELKLFETTWKDDFSKARNECISYATGDWILSIDGNQELTLKNQLELLNFLNKINYQNREAALYFKQINLGGENTVRFKPCCFKSGVGTEYKGILGGELINPHNDIINFNCPDLFLYNYSKETDNELISSLKQKISTNSQEYNYLGEFYAGTGEIEQALKYFYLAYNSFDKTGRASNIYGNILMNLVKNLFFIKDGYQESINFISEMLELSPQFPDIIFYFAYYKQKLNNYNAALEIYDHLLHILDLPEKDINPLAINTYGKALFWMTNYEMSRCYKALGDKLLELYYLERSYELHPYSPLLCLSLVKYHLLENNLAKATNYYFNLKPDYLNFAKKRFSRIIGLSPESEDYKTEILSFFKELAKENIWQADDLLEIKNKIKQYS